MLRQLLLAGPLLFAVSALAQGRLADECTDWDYRGNSWLVAKCLTGKGDERIESSLYLNSKITNDVAKLKVSRTLS